MPTTTSGAIRDRMITVITGTTPKSLTGDPFRPSANRHEADFIKQCELEPSGSFRLFQVRDIGDDVQDGPSNGDVEFRLVTFRILVCYPQTYRTNKAPPLNQQALDRDRVSDEDRFAINHNIGLNGAQNFTSPSPSATYMGTKPSRIIGKACDFLVLEQRMLYSHDVTGGALIAQQGSNLMVFVYTASGAESVAGFSIALPQPRVNTYAATVTCGAVADIIDFAVTVRTTTTITVVPTGVLTAGDTYFVTIEDVNA